LIIYYKKRWGKGRSPFFFLPLLEEGAGGGDKNYQPV